MSVKAGKQIEQYILRSVLGSGGMGTVYLAEDTRLHRKAALKFLAPEFSADRDHFERFIREARTASSLNHQNICTIYDVNAHPETPFIAMEYVEGESLSAMIKRSPRGIREMIDITRQVADALHEAHSAGLIHRDVKPSNVIVTARGRAKILDFGLAKKVDTGPQTAGEMSLTRPGMILGTASYMSPEQARGLEIDARSDLWSLGVTIYEMLTGRLPYSGETIADTLASVLTAEHKPLREIDQKFPQQLDDLISKLLAKRRDERFANAAEVLNALQQLECSISSQADAADQEDRKAGREEATQVLPNATTDVAHHAITGQEIRERNLRPNNLSSVLSPIIGRESEIGELIGMLRSDLRLITMTGIGGTGKTRLARAVAEETLADFADGVFFVDLAEVIEPDLVLPSIAKPFGINDGGAEPVEIALVDQLSGKDLLLVLDNFEQVLDAAPKIAELLAETTKLKALITSRSLLRLSFEQEFAVPPLSVAAADDSATLNDIMANAAVRLFETRAAAVKPGFHLNDSNARDVARICSRLEGLPLAIELAAARVRILSPSAILDRLDDRLGLLSGGPRDLPERHRTIHQMIDWSYGLLKETECRLFEQLSVFAGSFSIEAVEAICDPGMGSDDGASRPNILDLIASLSEKSLIAERSDRMGDTRFRMLEVVRDYAEEALAKSGMSSVIMRRHAEFFASLAESREPQIHAADPGKTFEIFESEHDNVRAAMRWSLANDHLVAVRIAASLRNFWLLHGHLTEGLGWLKAVSEIAGSAPAELRFKIFSGLGLSARFRGEHEISRAAYEAGLAACEDAGDLHGVAAANRGLGLVAMQQHELESAGKYFNRGLAISRELNDDFGVAMSLSFLGDLCRVEKRHSEARPMFEEAAALFRKQDRRVALGDSLNNLATAAFAEGDLGAAKEYFREAADIARDIGNKITLSHSLDGFGAISAERGDLRYAARLAAAAENLRTAVGYKNEPAESSFREAYIVKIREGLSPDEIEIEQQMVAGAEPFDLIAQDGAAIEAVTDRG